MQLTCLLGVGALAALRHVARRVVSCSGECSKRWEELDSKRSMPKPPPQSQRPAACLVRCRRRRSRNDTQCPCGVRLAGVCTCMPNSAPRHACNLATSALPATNFLPAHWWWPALAQRPGRPQLPAPARRHLQGQAKREKFRQGSNIQGSWSRQGVVIPSALLQRTRHDRGGACSLCSPMLSLGMRLLTWPLPAPLRRT